MTVTVNGTLALAERACRMVFGEDASVGPVRPAPAPLLKLLDDWPGRGDQVHKVALEMPFDFDVEKELGIREKPHIVLLIHRVTVLHQGRAVGYALRTNQCGLNAIAAWDSAQLAFQRRIRQAH